MHCLKCLFIISVTAWTSNNAVKVNMHGSLNLGKEVMDTISYYFNRNYANSRRSASHDNVEQDKITLAVKSMYLCRGLEVCEGKFTFVNDYIILLGNAVESIFEGILNPNAHEAARPTKGLIFEDQLNLLLHEVKQMLQTADQKVTEDKEAFIWIEIFKKISAKFQESVLNFVDQRLEGDPKDMNDVKKKLQQKLVLAIIIVESKFEGRLCIEYNLCEKGLEITMDLHKFLGHFKDASDEKARMFMKYFYESLPENVYYFLNQETANEFQIILNDMIYSEHVPTKDILLSVLKTIEVRLNIVKNNADLKKAYDVLLVHVILSDMDHFYHSRYRAYNFDEFLGHFSEWLTAGGRLHQEISAVMKDLKKRITDQTPDMIKKLTNQVKVFLELTVDPEN